jgi:hypothetical protein
MISACSGFSVSPLGAGTRASTASQNRATFSPVLALARIASCAEMPITSSISWIALAGSADGRSILFRTGITHPTPCSMAV